MNAFKAEVMGRASAKGWDQQILEVILGIADGRMSRILNCKVYRKSGLPAEFAMNLATVLGEDAMFWMTKQMGVVLQETSLLMEAELAAIRERAANWKPGMAAKPRSKSYQLGYADGFAAGQAAGGEGEL